MTVYDHGYRHCRFYSCFRRRSCRCIRAQVIGEGHRAKPYSDPPIDLIAFASDASFYRLIPQAVVLSKDVNEIQALFRLSQEHRIPLTFRAAGTSLCGQAVTGGILVEVARHWRSLKVEEGGRKVRVQPGVIGAHVNAALRCYGSRSRVDFYLYAGRDRCAPA